MRKVIYILIISNAAQHSKGNTMYTLESAIAAGYDEQDGIDDKKEFCPDCDEELCVYMDTIEFWGFKAKHIEKECKHCGYYEGP